MALNIKNAETEKLVRELARRRGQGITEVLTDVLRREVERERKRLGLTIPRLACAASTRS